MNKNKIIFKNKMPNYKVNKKKAFKPTKLSIISNTESESESENSLFYTRKTTQKEIHKIKLSQILFTLLVVLFIVSTLVIVVSFSASQIYFECKKFYVKH